MPDDPDQNAIILPSQRSVALQYTQTGTSPTPDILSDRVASSGTLGLSEASLIQQARLGAIALALASSLTLACDASMAPVLERFPIKLDSIKYIEARVEAAAPTMAELVAALCAEPIEDGVTHPAEPLVAAFARKHGGDGVRTALLESHRAKAQLLRVLGRATKLDAATRSAIVSDGLKSPDLETRDAAVQAAESWGDRGLAEILRAHQEPVDWFADYVRRVAADLEA